MKNIINNQSQSWTGIAFKLEWIWILSFDVHFVCLHWIERKENVRLSLKKNLISKFGRKTIWRNIFKKNKHNFSLKLLIHSDRQRLRYQSTPPKISSKCTLNCLANRSNSSLSSRQARMSCLFDMDSPWVTILEQSPDGLTPNWH